MIFPVLSLKKFPSGFEALWYKVEVVKNYAQSLIDDCSNHSSILEDVDRFWACTRTVMKTSAAHLGDQNKRTVPGKILKHVDKRPSRVSLFSDYGHYDQLSLTLFLDYIEDGLAYIH